MRITQLLKKESVNLSGIATSKVDVLRQLADLMEKSGNLVDKENYLAQVMEREEQGSTGIGEGIAIPHAKTAAVHAPGLAAMIIPNGVDFDSLDGMPADLFFLIAAPEGGENIHLDVLSHLSRLLMDDKFKKSLLEATDVDEFLKIIDTAEQEKFGTEESATSEVHDKNMGGTAQPVVVTEEDKVLSENTSSAEEKPFVVAVTACPTGIAHTYMAAEALEAKAKSMGIDIKVETNGSGGIKNALTKSEIARAKGVIVAADKDVPIHRFNGKRVIFEKVSSGIKEPERLITMIIEEKAPIFASKGGDDESTGSDGQESFGRVIYKAIMNGVSYMLPFVIGGGIMIALSFLADMNNAGAANFGSGTPLAAFLKNIGGMVFGMMMPILAGYIAMGIGGRAALMPGFVGGLLATTGGSGFFGALFAGFIAGYLIILLGKALSGLPKALEGTKPVLLFPVLGLLLIGVIIMYVVNPPMAIFNVWLMDTLASMTTVSKVVLGLIVGGMMSIDFGGPINKAAYVFGTASLASAAGTAVSSPIMAAVMIGGMVPPLAIAISMIFFKNKYTPKERESTVTNAIMGLSFITEGAIPFAAADPFRVIPACTIGAAIAGGLSMAFGCSVPAPHGGIFVVAVVTNGAMYVVALAIGAIISALLLGFLKKKIVQ